MCWVNFSAPFAYLQVNVCSSVKGKYLYEKHFIGNCLGFPQSRRRRSSEVKGRPGRAAMAYSSALLHLMPVEFRHSIAEASCPELEAKLQRIN